MNIKTFLEPKFWDEIEKYYINEEKQTLKGSLTKKIVNF